MIARVAVWEPMPNDDRDWLIDATRDVPGVRAAYHLVDPATGNGLSVAIFDDEDAMKATREAITQRAAEIGWHDQPHPSPKSETLYQVLRSAT
jgi:hypothetical protein